METMKKFILTCAISFISPNSWGAIQHLGAPPVEGTSIGPSTVSASQCLRSDSSGTHFQAGPGCGNTEAVFNDNQADVNLRAEGDGDENLLFLDAGLDFVGLGTPSPSTKLDVNGNAQFGSGATKSTFTAAGSLSLDNSATLRAGTTFFVGNGFVIHGATFTTPELISIMTKGDVVISNAQPKIVFEDTTSGSSGDDMYIEANALIMSFRNETDSITRHQLNMAGGNSTIGRSGGSLIIGSAATEGSKLRVHGSASFGDTPKLSSFTANGHFAPRCLTTAGLLAEVPDKLNVVICNSSINDLCIATGTSAGNWARIGSSGATGCF